MDEKLYNFEDGSGSLSWTLGTPPDNAEKISKIYDSFVPLTTEELETVVIQPGYRIILPIDWWQSTGPPYEQAHVFDKPLTLRGFLEFLYRFYNTELLLMDYPWAKKFFMRMPPGTSSSVTLREVMGDHTFYEGVGPGGLLHLGS